MNFYVVEDLPGQGLFTKDFTKGRGLNERQRSGLIDIKIIDFINDPNPS